MGFARCRCASRGSRAARNRYASGPPPRARVRVQRQPTYRRAPADGARRYRLRGRCVGGSGGGSPALWGGGRGRGVVHSSRTLLPLYTRAASSKYTHACAYVCACAALPPRTSPHQTTSPPTTRHDVIIIIIITIILYYIRRRPRFFFAVFRTRSPRTHDVDNDDRDAPSRPAPGPTLLLPPPPPGFLSASYTYYTAYARYLMIRVSLCESTPPPTPILYPRSAGAAAATAADGILSPSI